MRKCFERYGKGSDCIFLKMYGLLTWCSDIGGCGVYMGVHECACVWEGEKKGGKDVIRAFRKGFRSSFSNGFG